MVWHITVSVGLLVFAFLFLCYLFSKKDLQVTSGKRNIKEILQHRHGKFLKANTLTENIKFSP